MYTNLPEIRKMDGVKDLPLSVAGPFAMALRDEEAGDFEKATTNFQKALDAEAKLRA